MTPRRSDARGLLPMNVSPGALIPVGARSRVMEVNGGIEELGSLCRRGSFV